MNRIEALKRILDLATTTMLAADPDEATVGNKDVLAGSIVQNLINEAENIPLMVQVNELLREHGILIVMCATVEQVQKKFPSDVPEGAVWAALVGAGQEAMMSQMGKLVHENLIAKAQLYVAKNYEVK